MQTESAVCLCPGDIVSGVLQIEYGGSLRKLSNKRHFRDSLLSDGHTLLEGVNELLFALSLFLDRFV